MAFLGQAGNTAGVGDDEMNKKRSVRLLEAGWYRVALVEDEAKPYGWGTGLNMQFQILAGAFENQRIFEFLCIEHKKSDQAQHIARVKLRELALAAGHKTPEDVQDTASIYGKPVMVEVYRAKDDTDYAEADGKKPRIGQFLSVTQWKEERSGEPTPGIGAAVPNNSPAPAVRSVEPVAEDIPF